MGSQGYKKYPPPKNGFSPVSAYRIMNIRKLMVSEGDSLTKAPGIQMTGNSRFWKSGQKNIFKTLLVTARQVVVFDVRRLRSQIYVRHIVFITFSISPV
jgi:hypothetical protein